MRIRIHISLANIVKSKIKTAMRAGRWPDKNWYASSPSFSPLYLPKYWRLKRTLARLSRISALLGDTDKARLKHSMEACNVLILQNIFKKCSV